MVSKNKKSLIYSVLLVFVAVIWGFAFVVQSEAMDYTGPFTFNGIRSLVGGMAILPVALIMGRNDRKQAQTAEEKKKAVKTLFIGGISCGVCLFLASSSQQIGLVGTSPGKAGFITALYIVLVPLIGLFTKKRIGWKAWLGVALATVGLYLLCVTENFTIVTSDLMVLLCALFYSLHIVVIGYFSPKTNGVMMSCIQFFVAGILSIPVALASEGMPDMNFITMAWKDVLYMGVMSSGVAFTLQVVAQKYVNETVASLLMSMESMFAAIFSWLVLHQGLSEKEVVGAVLMVIAIVLAQLPQKMNKKKTEEII